MAPTNDQNTIYLTPQEDERLRRNFKDRLQRCRELAGKPRQPSDPQSLRSQVIYADLMSDIASSPFPELQSSGGSKGFQDSIIAYSVGNPYPPCTVKLGELKPMSMHELRMDTHHRGRVLTVRRVAEVRQVVKLKVCSWTVVQDEEGEMERLEVVLHKEVHGRDRLESGEVFKIKEPYFTVGEQGELTLRVDHPSDLVMCAKEGGNSDGDEMGSAKEYKEEGNAALKEQDLPLAHERYTRGLAVAIKEGKKEEEVASDLYRNRAHVNLRLHRLDEAKSDALSSLTDLPDQKHRELDSKAYLRAGTAAYQLGEFAEAKHCFEEQQRLLPGDKEAKARIRKTEQRIKEQESGSYDFKKLKASLLLSSDRGTRVDGASFARNVEVKESPGRGRGLFAAKSMEAGEVIMAEKSFCVVWANEEALTSMTYDFRDDRIRVFPAGLCKAVVLKLLDNPSQVSKVLDLYGDYRGPETGLQRGQDADGAVIDVFQVHDIVARNAFGPDSSTSSGLWVLASYINHSCLPNSEKEYIGDLMVLRATGAISAGEEIMHAYDASTDYDARMEALLRTWGFECSCALCCAEKEDSPVVRKRRSELERQVDAVIERGDGGRLAFVKAGRLMKEIEGTYDEERYKGLPRMAVVRLKKWMSEAGKR